MRKIDMETEELKEIENKKFKDRIREIRQLNEDKLKV